MPRLPSEADYGVRPTPRVVGVRGYDASTLARAANIQPDLAGPANIHARAVGTATAGIAAGASGLAKGAFDAAESHARVQAASAKSTFLKAKVAADEAFETDEDYSTWAQRYEQTLTAAATESGKELPARYRESFDLAVQDTIGRSVAAMREKAREREKDESRGWLNSFIDGSLDGALRAKDELTRAQFLDGVSEAVEGMKGRGFLSAQEAEKLKRGTAEGYAKRKAATLKPRELLAALDSDSSFTKFLPPDQAEVLRTRAEDRIAREEEIAANKAARDAAAAERAEAKLARAAERAENKAFRDEARARAELSRSQAVFEADARVKVARGEVGHDVLDQLRKDKKIDDGVWATLSLAADEFAKKDAEATRLLERGLQFGHGAFADPKSKDDKKAVDVAFAATAKSWEGLAPEEQMDRAVAFAVEKSVTPQPLQGMIRSGLRSGDPAQAILAADTMERLRKSNPLLLDDFDKEDLRLGFSIQAHTTAGVPPKSAVQFSMEGMKQDKGTREIRERTFADERGPTATAQREADKKWLEKQNDTWGRDPNVPPEMTGEFERIAKEEFIRTGNLEAARTMALSTINNVWGRTQVGGASRYMKLAPEKFYGVTPNDTAADSKWMTEQLLADVTKGALGDPNNPITADRLNLVPDPSGINPGGRPAYLIMLERKDGADGIPILTTITDANGQPMRWVPDWNTSAEKARREGAQQKTIDKAKEQRAKNLNPMKGLGVVGETLPEAKSAVPR
jgi:hypothetical protein